IQIKPEEIKSGMNAYALPIEDLSKQIADVKLRPLLKNLFYVGTLAVFYKIEKEILVQVIQDAFKSKQSAIDANLQALQVGMDFAAKNLEKKDSFELQRGNLNKGKIVMDGNTAAALGCVYGGCTVVAWYPITPSSSLAETTESYLKKVRIDEKGKAK